MSDSRYQNLVERIRSEISDLEQVIDRAEQAWLRVETSPEDQYAYLDSVALNLHGFYSGLEKLFELVPEKMAGLMEFLPELWPGLSAELLAFADYLDALSATLSD